MWGLYGNRSGSAFLVKGFVQGPTKRSGTGVSSSSLRDFGAIPAPTGTLSGSITSETVDGTLSFGGSQALFSGARPAASSYTYDTPATVGQITGSWTLRALDGSSASVTISPPGSFTGTNAGCSISGTISPRPSGKNVFDVAVISGPAPCVAPGSVSVGIAVSYLLSGSTTRELVVAGVNSTRSAGNVFIGTR